MGYPGEGLQAGVAGNRRDVLLDKGIELRAAKPRVVSHHREAVLRQRRSRAMKAHDLFRGNVVRATRHLERRERGAVLAVVHLLDRDIYLLGIYSGLSPVVHDGGYDLRLQLGPDRHANLHWDPLVGAIQEAPVWPAM